MPLIPDYQLQSHNTLQVSAVAKYFTEVADEIELAKAVAFANHQGLPIFVIGGGSNTVFTQDYPGLIIKNAIKGIDIIEEHEDYSLVRIGAGVKWQDLVAYTLDFHLWGLENLTDIPGTVGAAPIQNIGAYGVELERFFVELQALNIQSQCPVTFDKSGCSFGYRDSVFKGRMKGEYIILSVTLKLAHEPDLVTDYGPLKERLQQLEKDGRGPVTPQILSQVVSQIRSEKIPDPNDVPNAGSFFKNPVVSDQQLEDIKEKYPGIVYYPFGEGYKKLAAGWLVEQAGWKGYEQNGVGVHKDQALVLINNGKVSGSELLQLAENIQDSIKKEFGVTLEIEPVIV